MPVMVWPTSSWRPARNPLAFLFSDLQCSRAGLAPFRFEALDHPIEGSFECADLARAVRRDRACGAEDVEFLHPVSEALQGREERP